MGRKIVSSDERQKTIDIDNKMLQTLIHKYQEKQDVQSLSELIEHLHGGRVLIPVIPNPKKEPVPLLIRSQNGDVFLGIFTQKDQIQPEKFAGQVQGIMNVTYMSMNRMCVQADIDIKGIVLNPHTDNLVFKKELLQRIEEVAENRSKGKQTQQGQQEAWIPQQQPQPQQPQQVQLTEDQFNVLMRRKFEFDFLPKTFFEKGQEFIELLEEQKGEYLDQLFEESYLEKRMYPFLPEDFSVMVMNIREDLQIIIVDLPERYLLASSCETLYFTWNEPEKTGRYFTIEKAQGEEERILGEITKDGRHDNYGPAPVEGAELAAIIRIQEGGDL